MVNPESFSRFSVFRFLSLGEVGRDSVLKSSYLEAMASFYREDEQAKAEGRTHQGYQERSATFPLASLENDFSKLVDYAQRLEDGAGPTRVAIRALVDVHSERVMGETFMRISRAPGGGTFCDPLSYVRPEDRGCGVGSTMFPMVMSEALRHGCESVKVSAREDNPASWRRFEKLVSAGVATRVRSSQQADGEPLWRSYEIKPEKWVDAAHVLAAKEPKLVDFSDRLGKRRSLLDSQNSIEAIGNGSRQQKQLTHA